jgi:hypothetical protein
MSARQVRGLKKLPGYIADQIDKVLEEGPDKANVEGEGRGAGAAKNKGRFTVWYFYGELTRDEMQAIDQAAGKPHSDDDSPDEAHCIVTLINDSVVKSAINPLDSGSFPYHSLPWQRRAEHWAGVGVAEQMRTPQKVTNAALRALLNNAGKSAGSQFVILEGGKAQIEQTKVHGELTLKAHGLQMQHEQALMDYANRMKISLDQAKAQLAKTAMQLQTERDLNAANNAHEMRKHRTPQAPKPPVQVPGRAARGHAFDQSTVQ